MRPTILSWENPHNHPTFLIDHFNLFISNHSKVTGSYFKNLKISHFKVSIERDCYWLYNYIIDHFKIINNYFKL